jgi:restriction endonuclease S subunit
MNTGIQPSVIVFERSGKTDTVEFWDVEKVASGELVETCMLKVEREKFNAACSFDLRSYQDNVVDTNSAGFPMIKLGDLITTTKGALQATKCDMGQYPVISISSKWSHSTFTDDGENVYIASTSSGASSGPFETVIKYYMGKASSTSLMQKLTIKCIDRLSYKFLYYYLNKIIKQIEQTCEKGSCNKTMNIERFLNISMPLPPLPIQQEIVESLDLIYNNANTAKLAASSIKAQMAAVMRSVGARGYEKKKVEDITILKGGFPFKSSDYVDSGLAVLKHNNLQNGSVEMSKGQDYIKQTTEMDNYLLRSGDLVVSMDFDCGKIGKIITDGWVLNQRMTLARTKDANIISQEYLYWLLRYGGFYEALQNVHTGTTIKHIS